MAAQKWVLDLHESIKKRNLIQSHSYADLIHSHQLLWAQTVYLENKRIEARHKLVSVEHDTVELMHKVGDDSSSEVRNLKNQLESVQNDLISYDMFSNDEIKGVVANNDYVSPKGKNKKLQSDLSKLVFEQKKLIANQNSEIDMAKKEIRAATERQVLVEQEFNTQKEKLDTLIDEVESLRRQLTISETERNNLRAENTNLMSRIMEEKSKTATQMNEINELFQGSH